jgi:hypothetical protein
VAKDRNLTPEDYANLKDAAKSTGVYCVPAGGALSCSKQGGTFATYGSTIAQGDPLISGLPKDYVFYVDYPTNTVPPPDPFATANTIKWQARVGACPDVVATLVVRYGSLEMASNGSDNGAFLVPEGELKISGGVTLEGTVIAKKVSSAGNASFKMSSCWLQNMPGPFLAVIPDAWIEVDR